MVRWSKPQFKHCSRATFQVGFFLSKQAPRLEIIRGEEPPITRPAPRSGVTCALPPRKRSTRLPEGAGRPARGRDLSSHLLQSPFLWAGGEGAAGRVAEGHQAAGFLDGDVRPRERTVSRVLRTDPSEQRRGSSVSSLRGSRCCWKAGSSAGLRGRPSRIHARDLWGGKLIYLDEASKESPSGSSVVHLPPSRRGKRPALSSSRPGSRVSASRYSLALWGASEVRSTQPGLDPQGGMFPGGEARVG